jgi:hypothetical protein
VRTENVPSGSRRFLTIFVATVAGWLAVVAVVNFVVNPYGNYRTSYFTPYSWNVRQAKATHLRETAVPNALILGSSRSFALSPEYIHQHTGLLAYNASVPSGRMIDHLAILRLTLSRPTAERLKVVLLGLDLGSFWPDIITPMELRATPSLFRYAGSEPARFSFSLVDDLRLIAFSQFEDSIRTLGQARTGQPPNLSVDPDGVVHFAQREQELRAGSYDLDAAVAEEMPYLEESYARKWQLSETHTARFMQIVELCHSYGIRLVVSLMPDHPRAIERLRSLGWEENRDRLLALLKQEQARGPWFDLFDFSSIDRFGGTSDAFINATHVTAPNAEKMLAPMLQTMSDAVQ